MFMHFFFTPYVVNVQTGELNPMGALLLHSLGSSPFSLCINESKNHSKEEKGPSREHCYCQPHQAIVFSSKPLSRGFTNFLCNTSLILATTKQNNIRSVVYFELQLKCAL